MPASAPRRTPPDPVGAAPLDAVRLERVGPVGYCPNYTVEIRADGAVNYEGKDSASIVGPRAAQIAPDKAQALLARFADAGFWGWQGEYGLGLARWPRSILTVTAGGRTKRIENKAACGYKFPERGDAPEAFCALEAEVIERAGVGAWINGNKPPLAVCHERE